MRMQIEALDSRQSGKESVPPADPMVQVQYQIAKFGEDAISPLRVAPHSS